jgi:16S rRNA processing protein RimM
MLLVGIVRRPHGLGGEVSVEPLTDVPERFTPGGRVEWRRGENAKTLTVLSARTHGGRLLIAFDGIAGVDAARALSGGELEVPEEDALPPRPGWYMSHQIVGWRCEDLAGRFAGVVRNLETTPAGGLLSIETPSGKEALVPFVHPIVVLVDDASRRIVIDPPEGLLEI